MKRPDLLDIAVIVFVLSITALSISYPHMTPHAARLMVFP